MNESTNNPAADRSSIAEALTSTLRQPSFLRVMLVLAATVVVLVGIRLGAPILNPILFAVVLSLLFSPLYSWLLRRRLPTGLAPKLSNFLLYLRNCLEKLFGNSRRNPEPRLGNQQKGK